MSIHYFILAGVRTTPKTTARINVGAAEPSQVIFTLYPPGAAMITDTLNLDANNFVSSASSTKPEVANLFTGSGGQTALVRVETQPAGRATAVLEQSSSDGKILLCAPAVVAAAGAFLVPVGQIQRGVDLLIGNIGDDAAIEVQYGASAAINLGTLARHAVLTHTVTQGNTTLRIVGTGPSVNLLCQLAVDTGKTDVAIIPGA
jgi:hypothetical protein